MKDFFAKLFSFLNTSTAPSTSNLGANLEKPSEPQIEFKELVAEADVVKWVEKDPTTTRTFPAKNQGSSGACVANTRSKQVGILQFLKNGHYIPFSAADIYRRRSNKPDGGMIALDSYRIASQGVTLEDLVPSDLLSDYQIDALKPEDYKNDVGKIFALGGDPIVLPIGDIDAIASVIQKTKKGVMVWYYFNSAEWSRSRPVVQNASLNLNASATLRHSVTAVDYCLVGGVKTLIIEDSAWFGNINRREITESFHKARNWYADYPMQFKFDTPSTARPSYVAGNVRSLQDCLKYEGLFPSNVESTGVFGTVTTQAVRDFQKKYGLDQVGTVGPKTEAKLRALYP